MVPTTHDEIVRMLPYPPDSPFTTSRGNTIFYQGPTLKEGIKPAVIYFSLSGRMSLQAHPFNQPVLPLCEGGIRVFSWDLPFHGDHLDPHDAMHHWASEFAKHSSFIKDFISLCQDNIDDLINLGVVDANHIAVAGLSRGGYIAAQLAARMPQIKAILGFAPLTKPQPLEEYKASTHSAADPLSLSSLTNDLTSTPIRFYIGNHDTRVSTDACYAFIRDLTETAFAQGVRSPQAELIIYPSIGHKGHGTPTSVFLDGAEWIKRQLLP